MSAHWEQSNSRIWTLWLSAAFPFRWLTPVMSLPCCWFSAGWLSWFPDPLWAASVFKAQPCFRPKGIPLMLAVSLLFPFATFRTAVLLGISGWVEYLVLPISLWIARTDSCWSRSHFYLFLVHAWLVTLLGGPRSPGTLWRVLSCSPAPPPFLPAFSASKGSTPLIPSSLSENSSGSGGLLIFMLPRPKLMILIVFARVAVFPGKSDGHWRWADCGGSW